MFMGTGGMPKLEEHVSKLKLDIILIDILLLILLLIDKLLIQSDSEGGIHPITLPMSTNPLE